MSGRARLLALAAAPLAIVSAVGGGLWWWQGSAAGHAAAIELGGRVYAENCAACHGVELEGQPDWRRRLPSGRMPAPPHDASGHTWHHSDDALFRLVRDGPAAVVGGGYESDMPGFDEVLSDAEIRAVLEFIKSHWPERERRYQAEATLRDKETNR